MVFVWVWGLEDLFERLFSRLFCVVLGWFGSLGDFQWCVWWLLVCGAVDFGCA